MNDTNNSPITQEDILSYIKVQNLLLKMAWAAKDNFISHEPQQASAPKEPTPEELAALSPEEHPLAKAIDKVQKKQKASKKDVKEAEVEKRVPLYQDDSILSTPELAHCLGVRDPIISLWRSEGINIPFHKDHKRRSYYYIFKELKHLINEYGEPVYGYAKRPPVPPKHLKLAPKNTTKTSDQPNLKVLPTPREVIEVETRRRKLVKVVVEKRKPRKNKITQSV